jgi:hypothetical protein
MIFNLSYNINYPVKVQERAITCFKDSLCFGDEELMIKEPFNKHNHCKSWANNMVFRINDYKDGSNMLTRIKDKSFSITEIELWQV